MMNQRARSKLLLSLYLTVISGTVLASRFFVVPNVPIILALCFPSFLIIIFFGIVRKSKVIPIGVSVLLSVLIKLLSFIGPPSLIGMDPDRFAMFISQIVSDGAIIGNFTSLFYSTFYPNAPLFFLETAITKLVLDVAVVDSMGVWSVIAGVLVPLLLYLLVAKVTSSPESQTIVLLLAPIAVVATHFAFWPIPQTMMNILFLCIVVCVYNLSIGGDRQHLLLVSLFFVTGIFSHKLFSALLFLYVLILWGYQTLGRCSASFTNVDMDVNYRVSVELLVLSGVFIFVQYEIMSNYLAEVVLRLRALVFLSTLVQKSVEFVAVSPVYTSIEHFLVLNINWLYILPTAVLGFGLLLLVNRDRYLYLILFGVVPILSVVFVLGFVEYIFVAPIRVYSLLELLAIPLVAIFCGTILSSSRVWSIHSLERGVKGATALLLVLIVVSQLVSVHMVVASAGEPRFYLNNEEIAAKEFTDRHTEGKVGTDFYYKEEALPANINKGRETTEKFTNINHALFNASIDQLGDQILLRNDVGIYRSRYGWYWLEWDPTQHIPYAYSAVYDAGNTNLYTKESSVENDDSEI